VPGWAAGDKGACWNPPEGTRLLLVQGQTGLSAFEADTGKLIKDYGQAPGLPGRPLQILWTKDGPQLAVAHAVQLTPKGLRLSVQTGPHSVGEASADQGMVEFVDLDKRKSRFTAKPAGNEAYAPQPDPVWAMAWKPDGSELATIHEDGYLRIWDAVTCRSLRRLKLAANFNGVYAVPPYPIVTGTLTWASDGKSLAYARENRVQIWDLAEEGKSRTWLAGADAPGVVRLLSLAWSPDGRRVAALANRGRNAVAKVWEASTGKELNSWEIDGQAGDGVAGLVAWSPDGKHVAAGVRSVHVWDVDKGQEVLEGV
jgi:WD40 repeat protein